MNIKIAVPDNPIYAPLIARVEEVCKAQKFDLVRTTEARCAELLLRNSVEIALLSPLGYGKGVSTVDYRIIRGPALTLEGLTYLASVYFRPNSFNIAEFVSATPSDFINQAGAIALSEKFDIPFNLTGKSGTIAELLEQNDAVISWGNDDSQIVSLDVSDEWTDGVETALPVAFWVCRPDEMPENLEEIIAEMAAPDLPVEVLVHEKTIAGLPNAEREGKIMWKWNDQTENGLKKAIEMMFYLQLVPEISAVKIWGRELLE